MNIESFWNQSKWDDAEWTLYSANWDSARWDDIFWDFCFLGKFREILRNMEKVNIGEYLFTPGTCVPGMDNFKSVARDVLEKLEK
jgi:hypothetical protein